jgi:hypothetical protein
MKSNRFTWSAIQWGVMTALAGMLAGCGGGGGDAPPPPATLILTPANHETVSHATAAGVMSFASTSSIPLAASSSVADRKSLQAAGFLTPSATTARWVGLMLQSARASTPSSTTGRAHPLAVIGPRIDSCQFGGTTSTTFDDQNGNTVLDIGDVSTVVFNSCVVAPGETLSGTATLAITGLSATSLTAGLTFTTFSDVTAKHSLTLNGSLLFSFSVSTPSSTVANFRTTANGPVVANVTTHLPFSDTVTLQSGFVTD